MRFINRTLVRKIILLLAPLAAAFTTVTRVCAARF